MVQAATLINSGTIIGGAGGFGQNTMLETGQGGGGVLIVDALVIDSGRIAGGPAGQGPAGYAVSFLTSGTLELATGAVIAGEVEGDAGFADVLEFSGSGSFGSGFTDMTDISFATGAAWTVAGDAANLAGGQQISGFAAGSFIVLDDFTNDAAPGFSGGTLALTDTVSNAALAMTFATALTGDLLVKAGGGNTTLSLVPVTSGITLAAGDDEVVLTGGTATKLTVDAGAAVTVADGGQLTSATVKGVLQVLSGGAATDLSVATNAILTVSGGGVENTTIAASGGAYFTGGVASNTTLAGGYMELSAGAQISGTFDFKGKGGILQVEEAPLPMVVISGFAAGDQIILDDTAFAGGKVKVTANGELTISEGGKSYELDIAGAKKGSKDYVFSNHTLTEKSTAMAFMRPVASAVPATTVLPESLAAGGFQAMAAPTMSPINAATSAYGGFVFEPLQVPNGGIQTMVTLQN
jgi:autotransporter passenger strand-loop-strand repeat protein